MRLVSRAHGLKGQGGALNPYAVILRSEAAAPED